MDSLVEWCGDLPCCRDQKCGEHGGTIGVVFGCCGCCSACFVILGLAIMIIVFISTSIHKVEYDEIAVSYDTWNGKIDGFRGPGLYWAFLRKKFVKYPKFPVSLRFADYREPFHSSSGVASFVSSPRSVPSAPSSRRSSWTSAPSPSSPTSRSSGDPYDDITDDTSYSSVKSSEQEAFRIDRPRFTSRTSEGVKVEFDIMIFYQLRGSEEPADDDSNSLVRLHRFFGPDYEEVFLREAESIISQVCGEWTAEDLMQFKGTFIGDIEMRTGLSGRLVEVFDEFFWADIVDVIVSHIYLWETFEDAIQAKVVEGQRKIELGIRKAEAESLGRQGVFTSQIDSEIAVANADADGRIDLLERIVDGNLTVYETQKLTGLYQNLQSTFGANMSFVNNYYWYTTLMKKTDVTFVYNLLSDQYFDVRYNETGP